MHLQVLNPRNLLLKQFLVKCCLVYNLFEAVLHETDVLSRSAEEFENDQSVEVMWAMEAYNHAEVYFNILCSADPKYLKLTSIDDMLYKAFRSDFPSLYLTIIDQDMINSPQSKEKWRIFCEKFKNVIEDYNLGTLLRIDATKDYTEENSLLVVRVQFLAIELARNREGINDGLRKFGK